MQALHDLGKEKGIEPEVILEAVEAGVIDPSRHASYVRLYEQASQLKEWEY